MEAITSQHIKESLAAHKATVPWKDDEPYPQSYFAFDATTTSWLPKTPADQAALNASFNSIDTITLRSWNIDFMLPFPEARMKSALAHLGTLVADSPPSPTSANVIFLQECTPSDFKTITSTPWVRERFVLTDIDTTNWATTHYGTVTLIDKHLPIAGVFRVHYSKTRMDRDGLFVDVRVGGDKTVRLCNTHLESLALEPPFRPAQVEVFAKYLREEKVHAGLAAGDFNAIQPFDRTLHSDNGLKDAYLEKGGKEDADEGYTWGQQASTKLREQFGCSRMDKVYFCGEAEIVKFERFGADVLVEGEEENMKIVELGFDKAWVTDHLGVMAKVKIVADKSGSKI